MKHAPFPANKPSQVEWIGDIPKHWMMSRLRFLANISTGDADTVDAIEAGQYPFFVRSPQIHAIDSYCYDGEAVLLAGDGNVEDTIHHYIGKYDCHQRVYQLNQLTNIDGRYLYYYTTACFRSWISDGTAKSTVASLRMPMLQNFPVPLPPLGEQHTIAAFLDCETAKVDALIAKKHQLIDRLVEYRTALITRTVTRGLPPDVAEVEGFDQSPQLKPSGVEWLGKVPEHWLLTRLRYLAAISTGDADTIDAVDGGQYPFFVRSPQIYAINSYCYDGEALLLAGDGNVEDTIHHYVGKYECHQRVYQINQLTHAAGRYLYYYMKACFRSWITDGTAKSTVASLRMPMLQNFPIALPPLEEQQAIAMFLDRQMERIAALSSRVEAAIERLHEFRSALVTAAVTGKIDVREFEPVEMEGSAA